MEYISVKEASKLWKISERRIVKLCNGDRIDGAYKGGMSWNIPISTAKPVDKRTRYSKIKQDTKTMVIAGINWELGKSLSKIIIKEGYKVIGLYQKGSLVDKELINPSIELIEIDYFNKADMLRICASIEEYLDGFVFMERYHHYEDYFDFDYDDFENSYKVNFFAMNLLVRELVKKMKYESSIVIMNTIGAIKGSLNTSAFSTAQSAKSNLVQMLSGAFSELYGVRINSVIVGWVDKISLEEDAKAKREIPMQRFGAPEEIADDIFLMLTRHKYTTGTNFISDGGYLAMDSYAKTEAISNGTYYKLLNKFITEAEINSTIWSVSFGGQNDWENGPLEVKFRKNNIDAVNRGVNMERIFVFDKKDLQKYKGCALVEMCIANDKINSLFVDRNLLEKERKDLINNLGNGISGIDDYVMLVDVPNTKDVRGHATFNKKEIEKIKNDFNELKKYGIPLKEAFRRTRK